MSKLLKNRKGSGCIYVTGNTSVPSNVAVSGRIILNYNSVRIDIQGFTLEATVGDAIQCSYNDKCISLRYLIATGETSSYNGLSATASPTVYINSSTISNKKYGVVAYQLSGVWSYNNIGTNNATGIRASASVVMKSGSQPGGTTAESTDSGGVIR